MRAFDVIGIGLALVLVASLSWALGRFAGRRDWKITSIVAGSIGLAVLIQLDILAVLTLLEPAALAGPAVDFTTRFSRRLLEAASSPEFSVFLMILGSFIGILGWSSTPARKTA